jgi:alkanesulfonate monooxygenase SsuD/methylene tetrahydromethanopterin reductase-like flavin-dependent oxidoreductase (luciferase family)
MEEGAAVLVQAWTQERVSFHGEHWDFVDIPVYPKPRSKPHPPIAVAAISEDSVRWAAQHGYRILSSGLGTPLPALTQLRARYAAALAQAEHDPALVERLLGQWTVTKHVYVAETDAEARATAEPYERWYLDSFVRSLRPDGLVGLSDTVRRQANEFADRASQRRWEDLIEDSLLIGSPTTVLAKVQELAAAGVGELACWMNFGGLPIDNVRRSMKLFSEEVIPALRTTPIPST